MLWNIHGYGVEEDALLAQATVPEGRYTRVRLVIDKATVDGPDGRRQVTVPNGASGLELEVKCSVDEQRLTELLVDFNFQTALIEEGDGYRFSSTIPVVEKALTGSISGTASDPANGFKPLRGALVAVTYTAGSAYPPGTVAYTSATSRSAGYKLWALRPGTYSLTFTYTDSDTGQTHTVTQPNVVVRAGYDTALPNVAGAAHRDACIAILKKIAWAKEQWSGGRMDGTPCSFTDLTGPSGFLEGPFSGPTCPANGVYTVNPVGSNPTCTERGHELPYPPRKTP